MTENTSFNHFFSKDKYREYEGIKQNVKLDECSDSACDKAMLSWCLARSGVRWLVFDLGQPRCGWLINERCLLIFIKANCATNPLSPASIVSNISDDFISCSLTTN